MFTGAAAGGHVNILEWLLQDGYPVPDLTRAANFNNKPQVIQWLELNGLSEI